MQHVGRFEQIGLAPAAPIGVTVGASPYTLTAPSDGLVIVADGSVSLIQYGRGSTLTALGLVGGLIPVRTGDSIRITWAITAPTVTFLAN